MLRNIMYELDYIQLAKLRRKSDHFTSFKLNTTQKIQLEMVEVLPKSPYGIVPVVILLHGYTSRFRRLAYVAYMFISRGFAVLMVNLRGHGKSSGKRNDIIGMQQDLDSIVQYIESKEYFDPNNILLMGISLGGLIGLTSAYNHPKVRFIIALASLSSPLDMLNAMTHFRRWRWRLIARLGGLNIPAMVGKSQFIPKIQPNSNKLRKNILLMHCKNDKLIRANNFWMNVAAFQLDESDYRLFTHGGHSFFLIKQKVIDTISNWLNVHGF